MIKRLILAVLMLLLAATAHATTYYVNPDGDGTTGLSDAHAFKTVAAVNSKAFATGDDVYFRCGKTWGSGTLTIDWSGTSGNRAVVGAYYMTGSVETPGVSGAKPILTGNTRTGPGDIYTPLVMVQGDYVTVEYLDIRESRGRGLTVYNAGSNGADYVKVDHCYFTGNYSTTVMWYTGSDYGEFSNNEVYYNGYWDFNDGGDWGAVVLAWNNDHWWAHHNEIHHNWGEGLNGYNHATNILMEYNTVYDNNRVNIYLSCTKDATVRYNLAYNSTDMLGGPPGIVWGAEDYCKNNSWNSGIIIYGNMVASTNGSIAYWGNGGLSAFSGAYVYNNTCVQAYSSSGATGISIDANITSSAIKNNLVWQTSGSQASMPSVIDQNNNLWTTLPSDADARGSNDPAAGAPTLAKMTGWNSIAPGSLTVDSFKIQPGSRGLNGALALGGSYNTDYWGISGDDIGASQLAATDDPPTAAVTYPTSGSSVSGTVTLTASATDDLGVAGVQFAVDGANVGSEDTAPPYSYAWNSTLVAAGSHTVKATSRDSTGHTTASSTITFTVVDITAPAVSITYPTSGATVAGTISFTATATDATGVSGVQFKLDGSNLGSEDTASPYSLSWNSLSVSNGSHTITATARDAAGNSATATVITFTVNNDVTAPAVTITVPTEGATVSGGAVTITATATDAVGVVGLRIMIDGVYYGSEDLASPFTWSWNTLAAVANGAHEIIAVARDAAGNLGYSAVRNVTVSNALSTAPVLRLQGSFNAQ